jgi:phosphoglycolate phosphatase-like HAD superfamily hydrolase
MKQILFDIDKTLIRVEGIVDKESSREMFKKIYRIEAFEGMVTTYAKTEYYIISEILKKFNLSVENVEEACFCWGKMIRKWLKKYPPRILPGIKDLLEFLKKKENFQLGILTGNSTWRAMEKLKAVGLIDYFYDKKVGKLKGVFGEMARERKELLEIFIKKVNDKKDIVVIDDSLEGAKMGKELGVKVIGVATGETKKEDLLKYTQYVFSDFGEGRYREVERVLGY